MRNICIICEGPTETEFVTKCLVPHLIEHGVYPHARILQAPSGRHRGGRVSVERLVKHLSHEYRSYDRLTTLVDFYGFQDRDGRNRAELEDAILEALRACTTGFDERFVLPYVQMHEFEALLFSDIEQFEWVQDGWSEESRAKLQAVRAAYDNPEDINNSPQTAPSKRLLAILGEENYSKVEHGPLVAEAIGLDEIRRQCPQFNQWLSALEAWGN
ncbi:MAG TPA: hypothetical protein DDZ61_03370 [Aeromonas salmonicida]|uniref:DUF4276 family protein n=1 Tax=Aeromonas rivipollensis TaxID=948519 RepID=UPI000E8EFC7D|nr:DUF4276 family protein [Aeromonas rivipollensis]MCE9944532.1 DUF4276 family protein [Aeromonas rivipollensis]HBL01653.1 hypothetical protein [Aeromonas salmonicida]